MGVTDLGSRGAATLRAVLAASRYPLIRNFSVLAVGNLASRAALFLVNVHLARTLTPEYFGRLVLAQTLLLFAMALSDVGIRTVKVRDLAAGREGDADGIGRAWGTLLALSLLGAVAMVVAAALLGARDPTKGGLVLLFAATLPAYGLNVDWLLKGRQRFGPVGVAEVLKAVVYLGLVIAVVQREQDVLLVPVAYAAAWGLAALYVGGAARGVGPLPRPRVDRAQVRRLVAAGLPIGATGIVTQLYMNGGILFLDALGEPAEVGVYGAAFKLTLLITLMGALFSEALLPVLARRFASSPADARRLALRILRLLAAVSLVAALVLAGFAREILGLVYGERYLQADGVLAVLAVAVVALFCNIPFVNLLIVEGRQRYLLVGASIGLTVNVLLNVALVPRLGPLGAASAELGTEVAVAASMAAFALSGLGRRGPQPATSERTRS